MIIYCILWVGLWWGGRSRSGEVCGWVRTYGVDVGRDSPWCVSLEQIFSSRTPKNGIDLDAVQMIRYVLKCAIGNYKRFQFKEF